MPRDYTQTPAAAARRVYLRRRLAQAGTPAPPGASFADLLRRAIAAGARRALIADAAQATEEIDADELEAYAARIRAAARSASVPLRARQPGEQEPAP